MSLAQTIIRNQIARLAAGGIGAILAAIGGVTTIDALQPAVEKASDAAAKTLELYCKLPEIDRMRFRSEVMERAQEVARATNATAADVRVTCPLSLEVSR